MHCMKLLFTAGLSWTIVAAVVALSGGTTASAQDVVSEAADPDAIWRSIFARPVPAVVTDLEARRQELGAALFFGYSAVA